MKHVMQYFLLATCIISFCKEGYGQINYAGKKFYMTLGGDFFLRTPGSPIHLYGPLVFSISSKHHAIVQFYYTNSGATQTYSVQPDSVLLIEIPITAVSSISCLAPEQIENKSLYIHADSNITVNFVSGMIANDDGMTLIPVDNQRKVDIYYLLGLGWDRAYSIGDFSHQIVATCDSIVLEITLSDSSYAHPKGISFNVILMKGQTYNIASRRDSHGSGKHDPCGSTIKILSSSCCDVPINVFCNYSSLYIGPNDTGQKTCCADLVIEQLLPANWWDTAYPVVSFYRNTYARSRIVSSENNNALYFDNSYIKTLSKGEVFDTLISQHAMMVNAKKPIGLVQFMLSDGFDTNWGDGDPDMLWNMSIKQGVKESNFKYLPQYLRGGVSSDDFVLTILSKKSNVGTIRLNGASVSQYFKNFYVNPDWQYAHIKLSNLDTFTTYHLTSNDKMVAYVADVYTQGGYSHTLSDLVFDSTVANGVADMLIVFDTVYKCEKQRIMITGGPAQHYQWSTGDTTSNVWAIDTGMYWVKEIATGLCHPAYSLHYFRIIDTQNVTILEPITDTLLKCSSEHINLIAKDASTYKWSTGDTTQQISIIDTGFYEVTEIAGTICKQYSRLHSFYVSKKAFKIKVDLGIDTILCRDDYIILHTDVSGTTWSNGDTGKSIVVDDSGMYKAIVIDSCGDVHVDSIIVAFKFCPEKYCLLEFPNAFTPNADGKNDKFRPIKYGQMDSYHLFIYSRWGQLLFETYQDDEGWDGTYKGQAMSVGTYMYMCMTSCPKRGYRILKGDFILIK